MGTLLVLTTFNLTFKTAFIIQSRFKAKHTKAVLFDIFDSQNQFCNCLCPTQLKKDRYHLKHRNHFQEQTGKDLNENGEHKHEKQRIIHIRHIPNKSSQQTPHH